MFVFEMSSYDLSVSGISVHAMFANELSVSELSVNVMNIYRRIIFLLRLSMNVYEMSVNLGMMATRHPLDRLQSAYQDKIVTHQ